MSQTAPAIIWNGFHFRWKSYPHRLSILGSRFNEQDAGHEFRLKIGNWPKEQAEYTIPYCKVEAPGLTFMKGYQEVTLAGKIEQTSHNSRSIKVPLNSLPAGDSHHYNVLLNGFQLNSVNNHSGWHFGGLGIRLKNTRTEGAFLYFDVEVFTRPARSPEMLPHGNRKWSWRDDCIYTIGFDYLIVGGSKEDVKYTGKEIWRSASDPNKHFDQEEQHDIQGEVGYSSAFPGINGFQFRLGAHPRALFKRRTGRYLRELGFFAKDLNYNPETGVGQLKAGLKFSTLGERFKYLANPWMLDTGLDVQMIQLKNSSSVSSGLLKGATNRGETVQKQALG